MLHINNEEELKDHFAIVESVSLQSSVEPVECIFFTFTRMPCKDRYSTRIGGLPAWPKALEWPECQQCGEPLGFAAQLDFREYSRVKFDCLVLHYCFGCQPWEMEDGAAKLTALSHVADDQLVSDSIIPDNLEDDEPGPAYGVKHVFLDFPDDIVAKGTKIGGYPIDIDYSKTHLDSRGNPMEYLCCIGGLEGLKLPKLPNTPAVGDLNLGDLGEMSIWHSTQSDKEELHWSFECPS